MEQVSYNMLFRWFIGLSMDAAVWDVTVFTKNRDRLCYLGHLLMENRHGLIVDTETTQATGWAERAAAEAMIETAIDAGAPAGRVTLGADKGSDTAAHAACLRELGVTPHVAQHTNGRRSAIDGRTTRHPGHAISQRIERPFGWIEQAAGGVWVGTGARTELDGCSPSMPPPSTCYTPPLTRAFQPEPVWNFRTLP